MAATVTRAQRHNLSLVKETEVGCCYPILIQRNTERYGYRWEINADARSINRGSDVRQFQLRHNRAKAANELAAVTQPKRPSNRSVDTCFVTSSWFEAIHRYYCDRLCTYIMRRLINFDLLALFLQHNDSYSEKGSGVNWIVKYETDSRMIRRDVSFSIVRHRDRCRDYGPK